MKSTLKQTKKRANNKPKKRSNQTIWTNIIPIPPVLSENKIKIDINIYCTCCLGMAKPKHYDGERNARRKKRIQQPTNHFQFHNICYSLKK